MGRPQAFPRMISMPFALTCYPCKGAIPTVPELPCGSCTSLHFKSASRPIMTGILALWQFVYPLKQVKHPEQDQMPFPELFTQVRREP